MLKEMASLGFEWAELSHGVRITLVPGILRAVEEGVIKISSCHNFCPLPTGITHAAPNLYVPSAKDRREREQWLRHSKRSVEFAAQVGAKKLVMHLGNLEFFWMNPVRKVERYVDAHPGEDLTKDVAYRKLLGGVMSKLRAHKQLFWENTRASIAELLPYATKNGIALALENREKLEELPLDDDYAPYVETLPQDLLAGYWHDTGHAHIKASLGVIDHREHLTKNAPRAIGFHLHDVSADGHDHQAIGSGKIDFAMVSEFWRPEHTLVLEFSPRLTVEDVIVSKQRAELLIRNRFGG
ncbi:MAG: sugar phosphate isomerase/epimerase [Candidatus Didemnitutus sp.]|nr:sugar phosphate isomerase/epimerase [Candidatus Didemnitutus sp.]